MTTRQPRQQRQPDNNDNIKLDELIKYHEEKRKAFNKLLIAMQKDTEKKIKKKEKK